MQQIVYDPKDPTIPMPSAHYYCDKREVEVVPFANETRIRRWLDGSRGPSYAVTCRVCGDTHVFALVPVVEDYLLKHTVRIELHEGHVVRIEELARLVDVDLRALADQWAGLSAAEAEAAIKAEFEREFGPK